MIIDTFLKDLFELFLSYMEIDFQFKEVLIRDHIGCIGMFS